MSGGGIIQVRCNLIRISTYIRSLSYAFAVIAMIEVATLVLITVYDVILRFAFNAPTIWAHQLASMLSGTLFYLAAGYTLRERGHVAIDFLSVKLPTHIQAIIQVFFYTFMFIPVLAWITFAVATKAWGALVSGSVDYTSLWAPLMWPFYATIAIGLFALLLECVVLVLDRWREGWASCPGRPSRS